MNHHHCVHSAHSCTADPTSSEPNKVRLLGTALILVSCFSIAELTVGIWSHSLALLAESGHMISDSLALIVALLAAWIAQRGNKIVGASESSSAWEIYSALINGIGLVAIATWIAWEAITRLQSPSSEILSEPMLITASVGLVVNSINALLLHPSAHHDLNLRGAFLHVVADVISSVGVIVAAIAVWLMHWLWADGLVSLFVSGLIFIGAIPLIRQSLQMLRS